MVSWTQILINALALASVFEGGRASHVSLSNIYEAAEAVTYQLGDTTYLANAKSPQGTLTIINPKDNNPHAAGRIKALTVIIANETIVTAHYISVIISSYLANDDVFSAGFLGSVYITSSAPNASIQADALEYLSSVGAEIIFIDSSVFKIQSGRAILVQYTSAKILAPGPYTAVMSKDKVSLLDTYRLYPDTYRDFVTGIYPSNDGSGSFMPLQSMSSRLWAPLVPVPSRIQAWGDSRPLAGKRVAVKDIFDIKGLQTSAGSQAWIQTTSLANRTAPAIQRLVDLGAVLVGKQKLAQFASGANPWDWTDGQAPFNPRGDEYLTCAASTSGGACSIAAYDWLDAAIGSDTGVSIRRPAAVTGTFGNRPSQGMITLEGMLAQNWAQDTAGVLGRNPAEWAKFAKAWYTPELHQPESITGLSPLSVQDTTTFPAQILYPDEQFPLLNPAAQEIVDTVLSSIANALNMTIKHTNLSATLVDAPILSDKKDSLDRLLMATATLTYWSSHVAVADPLMTEWGRRYEGRFPPVDPLWRKEWSQFNASMINQAAYDQALRDKRKGVDWFEKNVLPETPQSCSESLLICDIGTGGLPSFREKALNEGPNATFLGRVPDGAAIPCSMICPIFGCADFTIPLGQVPYHSPVSNVTEQFPVSINMIVRRGCDFVLFNMVEKLAQAGVIRTVKTGKQAF
ncbi:amidase signature domain-containing protein [Aspergillus pseudotamarii]|uniref:Amidase signature domain-containing protein n=1 Tax=Aspergillus pseudotamarii TaxID=132259 RepID=A0A5N6SMI3_ASPPS|nr:amidase signature domain-containing protein [Aspergillus pseudotamarii]KAE8135908.1 amidase signature domain-containing protein [Aspergillus pseudotamarii]